MIEVLKQAKQIYDDYKTPDSQIDEGNLYWALGALLAELEKQEPVAWYIFQNDSATTDGVWAENNQDICEPLYTYPQPRKPLPEEQIIQILDKHLECVDTEYIKRAAKELAAHGIGDKS
jgi:hypothetical protein